MQVPDADALLRIWEDGGATPAQRAMALLAPSFPEAPLAHLVDASVGQRDLWLLDLRKALFGRTAMGQATCPRCRVRVEFDFDVDAFRVHIEAAPRTGRIEAEGYTIDFRTLTGRDLLRLRPPRGVEVARIDLIESAVVRATFEGRSVPAQSLPDSVVEVLGDAVWELDPQSEVPVSLECPDCGREWSVPFDVVSFLYREISARAERLIGDIHHLARAYGWSEAAILGMSPVRRRTYLELSGR